MEEGFLLDQGDSSRNQAEWVAGAPERSFWTGVKIKGKEKHPVRSYRCGRCGYLELYARDQ